MRIVYYEKYVFTFFCLLGLALFYNGCTNPDSLPVNPNDTDSIYEEIYDPAFYSWIDTETPDNSIDI